MFGNSHKDDSNQQNDMQAFGNDNQVAPTAPSLPTMGGQNSPFSPPPAVPQTPPPAPDPMAAAPFQDNPVDQPIPHHEDTSHMVTDHGTPDEPHAMHGAPQASGDLVGIKQQALSQLSPLVSHLEQSAEEKFRTTMMMIQATDDQSLLKEAYDAAQKIEDDKTRAQALLDVINEINYFTQQSK